MFLNKTTSILLIPLLAVFAVGGTVSCKKTPTAPQIEDVSRPVIWLSTFEMSFCACANGGNPPSQTLQIKNAGPSSLDYTIESDAGWLSVTPAAGTSSGQIVEHTVIVSKNGLAPQDAKYTAKVLVKSSQAYNNPQEVTVSLEVTSEPPPKIWVSTQQMIFNAQEDGQNPAFQNIQIRNQGESTLNYQLSADAGWLNISPQTGSSEGGLKTHKVSADISGMNEGTYQGKITISDHNATNSPQHVNVTLNINKNPPPTISVSPENLSFSGTAGGSNPSAKTLYVRNTGGGTLRYEIEWDAAWLSVSPASGQSAGAQKAHTVAVNTGGMSQGVYAGTITVSDGSATNSPQHVNVTIELGTPPTDNKISVSCSPTSGGTNTTVSVPISIKGNLSDITVFGLDLTFDSSVFQFLRVDRGSLTGSWAAVDGNEITSGTLKIGGFAGSGTTIPPGSTGTIAVVKMKVISTASSNKQTQLQISNYIDHIAGMIPSSTSCTFTYTK
jgi:hypothetical protein